MTPSRAAIRPAVHPAEIRGIVLWLRWDCGIQSPKGGGLSAHSYPSVIDTDAGFRRAAFVGLRADFDEHDHPVLAAERPAGRLDQLVRVEGMSDGTRDQLYLALRLATLEERPPSAERLPLVLDDVLIHWDDARAAATLSVLAEFSARTQVLLFTHHERTVELAARAGGASVVHHRLGLVPIRA